MRAWLLPAVLLFPARPAAAQAADTLPARVLQRQIETFNRRDLDGFMALYAEDAEVAEFPSGKVLFQGRDAIRAHYQEVLRTVPRDMLVRIEPRIVEGSYAVEHERWNAKPGERDHATWLYYISGGLIRKSWTIVNR